MAKARLFDVVRKMVAIIGIISWTVRITPSRLAAI